MKTDRISKYLSWLLRHCKDPVYIDLQGGWASVETILQLLRKRCREFDRQALEAIVAEDEKGRYSFDASGERIRANQGHSIPGVLIEMEKPVPPEYLYHGTLEESLPSIMEKGLLPMSRQYVHISPDYETAICVGSRHARGKGGRAERKQGGDNIRKNDGRADRQNGEGDGRKNGSRNGGTAVLEFAAGDFVRDGHDLWISSNGVWQAKIVPPQYLRVRVEYREKQLPADNGTVVPDPGGSAPAPVPDSERTRDDARDRVLGTDRYAIPCKYSLPVLRDKPLKGIILGIHGFSGSKESTGLHVLAKRVVPEGYGLVSFDLPSHWKSPASPQMLTVENAMRDILFMAGECRREFPDVPKYIFATSFGAYLTLLCCQEAARRESARREAARIEDACRESIHREAARRESGGELVDYRIILRAPAVTMSEIFLNLLNMSAEEFRNKAPLDCTNDPARPLPVYYSFYESLLRHSVFEAAQDTYPPMLVMHGDADRVVPPRDVRLFCEKYPQMDLHVIPGCDHGFTAPGALEEMCRLTMEYL
ncbi:MAG: RNA 2'-phosphotransferase [Eubacteriales bacterium]|nr:RNA 2'-phosphotransferase [Eubacteriales bacterium]